MTLDIEKCYDSVDVKKLKELLHKTELLEKDYYMLNCLVLRRKNNVLDEKEAKREPFKTHFRHKYQKLSVDGGLFPSLGEVVTEEDNDYNFKRSLLIECEPRRKIFKHEVLNPIDYIICNNYITFNKRQFKQRKGIPQGMCVSYILSSFYYSCLEDRALRFLKPQNVTDGSLNCVMRLTDDYLLMTTSKSNAMLFIERLFALSAENGYKFNAKKLRANFPVNIEKLTKLQHATGKVYGTGLAAQPAQAPSAASVA